MILIYIDVPYSLTRTKLRTTYYYEYIFEEIPAYVNSNVPWIDVEVEPSYAFLSFFFALDSMVAKII